MKKFLNKLHLPRWLIILLVITFILRIPSLFEPYSYGDETIYLTMGEAIRQGKVLYKDIHDNKPPLLYIVAAISGSLFWFKAMLTFWVLITIIVFSKFTKALFPKKKKLQKVATVIFALLTTIPFLEGNIANAEIFMIGPTIFAFYILWTKKLNFKNLFTSGLLFSVSTLFKVPAFFDVPTIIFFWLIIGGLRSKNIKSVTKNTIYLGIGYVLPIALTFVWYFARGGLQEYVEAAFLQNLGYLSSFRPEDIKDPFFIRNLPLLIRAVAVAVGIGAIYFFRKKLSKQFVFLTIWLFFSLFAATLSERPYPHYLVQSVPAVSVLFAMLFTLKNKEQTLSILPLTLAFFVPFYFRFWYYPTGVYYKKFVKFALGKIDKQEYLASFGGHVPRMYEIANFLVKSTKRKDKVLVWGPENQTVYALSRRLPPIKYIAQYHISDFSNKKIVLATIKNNKPKLIIILPDSSPFPELDQFLEKNYLQISSIDKAQVWYLRQITLN
jgi:4-amino-4-deoxy-L-arabinose transferase-like glycosyltransferase